MPFPQTQLGDLAAGYPDRRTASVNPRSLHSSYASSPSYPRTVRMAPPPRSAGLKPRLTQSQSMNSMPIATAQPQEGGTSFFSTPPKPKHRKTSWGSILTLPSFGIRSKASKEGRPRAQTYSPAMTRKISKPALDEMTLKEAVVFRCEIHALHGEDHVAAEAECKQMVLEAGGKILDDEFVYLGGFLYDMTDAEYENPLDDNDETSGGGGISVAPWMRFKAPQWNPLRMNPPDRALLSTTRPILPSRTPTQLSSIREWPLRPAQETESESEIGGWIEGLKGTSSYTTMSGASTPTRNKFGLREARIESPEDLDFCYPDTETLADTGSAEEDQRALNETDAVFWIDSASLSQCSGS